MLYNKKTRLIRKSKDCIKCEYFDKKKKKCNGLGVVCFEYDPKTSTCIDPITKLPIKL